MQFSRAVLSKDLVILESLKKVPASVFRLRKKVVLRDFSITNKVF